MMSRPRPGSRWPAGRKGRRRPPPSARCWDGFPSRTPVYAQWSALKGLSSSSSRGRAVRRLKECDTRRGGTMEIAKAGRAQQGWAGPRRGGAALRDFAGAFRRITFWSAVASHRSSPGGLPPPQTRAAPPKRRCSATGASSLTESGGKPPHSKPPAPNSPAMSHRAAPTTLAERAWRFRALPAFASSFSP
jgi:hypothetical protein